mmetsp:Transcript_5365/g.13417  ORF Transcript_5365/g.13417 Transcript_5365/m.13417 type:complete len:91 (-) Transcript_5365:113-385(-)
MKPSTQSSFTSTCTWTESMLLLLHEVFKILPRPCEEERPRRWMPATRGEVKRVAVFVVALLLLAGLLAALGVPASEATLCIASDDNNGNG